ncbi:MAG: aldo/keto reductase [Verrucomicrobia bacterium]|nr:aldo/keto reductase [Verrucomicrobiota bacterium]
MKSIRIGNSSLNAARLAFGCWRIAEPGTDGRAAVRSAYEAGYTLFDGADIYGGGKAEEVLGRVLREVPGMRERILITSKCGVRPAGTPSPDSPGRYDFSAQHIVNSCEQSLQRLGVETIDLYLLHRPDFLADPHEIAGAFVQLLGAGKVRFFGVSNFRPSLVSALQAACPLPLVVNQVEISLAKLDAFTDGTLDQCLERKLTPMAWSPLGAGLLGDGAKCLLPAKKTYRTDGIVKALDGVARARGVCRTAIALAWLLKHPASLMPIVGTTDPQRIRQATRSDELELTRDEWYRLLLAARGEALP